MASKRQAVTEVLFQPQGSIYTPPLGWVWTFLVNIDSFFLPCIPWYLATNFQACPLWLWCTSTSLELILTVWISSRISPRKLTSSWASDRQNDCSLQTGNMQTVQCSADVLSKSMSHSFHYRVLTLYRVILFIVCSFHFTLSLHFNPICRLPSVFYTDYRQSTSPWLSDRTFFAYWMASITLVAIHPESTSMDFVSITNKCCF